MILDFIYYCCVLDDIRVHMYKAAPRQKNILFEILQIRREQIYGEKIDEKTRKNSNETNRFLNNTSTKNIKEKKSRKSFIMQKKKQQINEIKRRKSMQIHNKKTQITINRRETQSNNLLTENLEKENRKENVNDLPYARAVSRDKRNIFQTFYSIIIPKLEFVNILFCSTNKFRIVLFSEYLLSLLVNFFFNALLYSDDVISNKYHNNGELDVIATISLSLVSNIVTSIICYFLNYTKQLDEKVELIRQLKVSQYYFKNVFVYMKYLKLKFYLFLFNQILAICFCYYYIVIFFIVYSCSTNSLIISYLTSLLEGLIVSVSLTIIILVLRKLGLFFSNRNFYNTSVYINTSC